MKHTEQPLDQSLLTITAAGFAATVAQILLLRELLVLFHGNEMSTALVLAGWLLWTALGSALSALLVGHRLPRQTDLTLLLTLQALGVPALVLFVRGARWLFAIPPGELAPLGKMLLVCLTAPVLFSPIAGALFGWCWAYRRARDSESGAGRPLAIYLGEALGASAGGLVFYFVLLRLLPALTTAILVAAILLGVSGWMQWRRRLVGGPARPPSVRSRADRLVWLLAAAGVLAILVRSDAVESSSRRWQWGQALAAAHDTPFHNIAVLKQRGQVTVFTNGLWMWTEPDPATAELAVHPALLQHPDPRRVLLLGGGLAGQLAEVLKHPGIDRVDYVEQDPELISFSEGFSAAATRASLRDPRVRIERQDAGNFLRWSVGEYDVILMSVGDPINAQMNRFYTEEFFRRLSERLQEGGLLGFTVPGGGDMVGPTHARFLGSLFRTVLQAFPAVRVLPGERARFFAAAEDQSLVLEPSILAARAFERGLDLVHLRQDTLEDLMSPLKVDYLEAILAQQSASPVNRQFAPICFFHGMRLWSSQWHPALGAWLERVAAISPRQVLAGTGALGVLGVLFFWFGKPRYRAAVGASVLVQGAWGMVLQVVLILTFQILAGYAYLQLALIIAFFMAGLAVGTLAVAILRRSWGEDARASVWLAVVQGAVAALPLSLVVFVSPLAEGLREGLTPLAVSWLFTLLSFAAGALGGSHFSLAVLAAAATGARLERTGGYLYAVDLMGAAGGALLAGLFLLPLFGVASTLLLLSLLALANLVTLLRRPAVVR